MDAVTVKKWCGISIAAVLTAVTIVWWVILNAFSPLGNQFASGRVPNQLLLYGRLIGILAAILFLVLLLTMGKGRTVERLFPKALLVKLHRRLGMSVFFLVLVHFILIFTAKSKLYDDGFWKLVIDFATDWKWGTAAISGVLILIAALIFCLFFIFKKMPFKKWKPTHYLMYAAVILLFFHQIFCGFDFINHEGFRIFWIAVFAAVLLDAAIWKFRMLWTK